MKKRLLRSVGVLVVLAGVGLVVGMWLWSTNKRAGDGKTAGPTNRIDTGLYEAIHKNSTLREVEAVAGPPTSTIDKDDAYNFVIRGDDFQALEPLHETYDSPERIKEVKAWFGENGMLTLGIDKDSKVVSKQFVPFVKRPPALHKDFRR